MIRRMLALSILALWGSDLQAQFFDPKAPLTGFYVAGHIGEAKADNICGGGAACDETADSFSGALGYDANPWLALELGYAVAGKFESLPVINGQLIRINTDVNFVSLSGVVSAPVGAGFSVFGRLGYTRWDLEVKVSDFFGNNAVKVTSNGYSPLLGFGAAYHFNRYGSVRLEYTHIPDIGEPSITGQTDGQVISVGAVLRF